MGLYKQEIPLIHLSYKAHLSELSKWDWVKLNQEIKNLSGVPKLFYILITNFNPLTECSAKVFHDCIVWTRSGRKSFQRKKVDEKEEIYTLEKNISFPPFFLEERKGHTTYNLTTLSMWKGHWHFETMVFERLCHYIVSKTLTYFCLWRNYFFDQEG